MRYEPHEEIYKGFHIRIVHDEDAENPRSDDNIGTIVTWCRRHIIGDEQPKNDKDEWLKDFQKEHGSAAIILPVYIYDHSGFTINTTGFSCRWDSGQIGWIYATHAKLREEMGWKLLTKKRIETATQNLVSEIAEYDNYLTGNCYGYVIEKNVTPTAEEPTYEEVEACWGFLGDYETDCLVEAKRVVDVWEKRSLPLFDAAGLLYDNTTSKPPT